MKRDSFVFYTSWIKGIEQLKEDDQAAIVFALMRYAAYGEEPKSKNPLVTMAYNYAKPQIDSNNKRYLASKKGGAPKGSHNNPKGRIITNHRLDNNKPNVYEGANGDEDDNENNYDYGNASVSTEQINPPTFEEVINYVHEAGLDIDAEHFYNYYACIGWVMSGGRPVIDWRAAARNWEKHADKFDY